MFYDDSLNQLQIHVVNNNCTAVNAELAYLKELVSKHNREHGTQYKMSEILSTPFNTMANVNITALEYAVKYDRQAIAASLRQYGAPETNVTAWVPSFWNLVNASLYKEPEVIDLTPQNRG